MVSGEYSGVTLPHIDQVEESDLHLLTRYARDRGGVVKVADGRLLFVPRGEAKSATGKTLATVHVAPHQVDDYRFSFAERDNYKSVSAQWHNTATGLRETITVGEGEPVFRVGRVFPDADAARAKAQAKYDAITRRQGTGSLTLSPGNMDARAEHPLILTGWPSDWPSDWGIKSAEHTYEDGGLSSTAEVETKK